MDAAHAHFTQGAHAQSSARWAEAAASYRKAISENPDFFEAQVNLGNALLELGQAQDALACFGRAQQLRPHVVELDLNAARALEALERFEAAIACYRNVQRVRQGAAEARPAGVAEAGGSPGPGYLERRIGNARMSQGDAPAAAECFRKALALDPENVELASVSLMSLLYNDAGAGEDVWREHQQLGARLSAHLPRMRHANVPEPERRLKVAYLSGDFRHHSVTYFIEPVLANHDRDAVQVHCYDLRGRADQVTRRIRTLAEHWTDCSTWSDADIAQRIQSDGVDILVDLAGHTEHNRFLVLARKPAPVQISWIGYPMGIGLAEIDFRLSDPRASPGLGARGACSTEAGESLYLLPEIFSCYRPPSHAPEPGRRSESADGSIVLASFNNLAKVSDDLIGLWARILRRRDDLRLLLKDGAFADEAARDRILARFRENGVEAARLSLRTRTPTDPGHLASYGEVDVALDTFPYGGVTTTCEALWMGVPVVSLAGKPFASRMGATLLGAIGHAEWVATDAEGYVEAVLALAADPARRALLRTALRDEMRGSALLDERGLAREVEAAYRDIWRRWCSRVQVSDAGTAYSRRDSPALSRP